MSPPADAPTLTAWIDTGGDGDQLHIRVTEDGAEYETVDLDLETLLQTEQFMASLSRPALSLLSLYDRAVADETEAEVEAGTTPDDVEVA